MKILLKRLLVLQVILLATILLSPLIILLSSVIYNYHKIDEDRNNMVFKYPTGEVKDTMQAFTKILDQTPTVTPSPPTPKMLKEVLRGYSYIDDKLEINGKQLGPINSLKINEKLDTIDVFKSLRKDEALRLLRMVIYLKENNITSSGRATEEPDAHVCFGYKDFKSGGLLARESGYYRVISIIGSASDTMNYQFKSQYKIYDVKDSLMLYGWKKRR